MLALRGAVQRIENDLDEKFMSIDMRFAAIYPKKQAAQTQAMQSRAFACLISEATLFVLSPSE